jgi:hypothetical protein
VLADELLDPLLRHSLRLGAERVDQHGERVCDADRVRHLDLAAVGDARRDDVLRHVARGVRAERSTFVGSLPENAPPPCGAAPP